MITNWVKRSRFKDRKNKYAGSTHAEFEGLRNSLANAQKEMEGRHYLETEGLKRAFDDAVWSTKTIYDGDKMSTNEALRVKEHEARTACQKLEGMLEQAETMLGEWGLPTHYAELPKVDPVKVPEGASPGRALLEEYVKKGEKQFNTLKSLSLPRLLKWIYVIPLGILLAIGLFMIVWKSSGSMGLGATGIPAAAVIAFAIIYSGKQVASWQARKATEPLGDLVAEALTLEPHCKREADVETKRELKRLQDQKNADLAAHEAKFVPEIKQQKTTFEAEAKAFFTSKDAQLANMQGRVKTEIEMIENDYSELKQSLESRFDTELKTAEANYQRAMRSPCGRSTTKPSKAWLASRVLLSPTSRAKPSGSTVKSTRSAHRGKTGKRCPHQQLCPMSSGSAPTPSTSTRWLAVCLSMMN